MGHPQLRKRPAYANHGHGPWRLTCSLPQHQNRRRLRQMKRTTKKSISRPIRSAETNAPSEPLFTASELKAIAERIMKFSEADETEVEIDVTTDALTRFANNIIHQNEI